MNILKAQTDKQWQLIEKFKEKGTKYTPASGTVAIDNKKLNKHKANDISSDTIIGQKTIRPYKIKMNKQVKSLLSQ